MTELTCPNTDCTFNETGICVQGHEDPKDCPENRPKLGDLGGSVDHADLSEPRAAVEGELEQSSAGAAVLTAPEERVALPRSGTLGLLDADKLMTSTYTNLVGIVGLPDSGKTACLVSLYLLLARGQLAGFSYANSSTLMALDEISRGARRWNEGQPPVQMTSHTQMLDDREAGFLHLRLKRQADDKVFDLLLPDLPGEWSQSLIRDGSAERLFFLRSAEVIWLMVDGREFANEETRQWATHLATNLLERLATALDGSSPRIIVVSSWRDKAEFPPEAEAKIRSFAADLGFTVQFVSIASFSEADDVEPGSGLSDLISATLQHSQERPPFWPDSSVKGEREFLNYGRQS